jgi:hypothetical protein
MMTLFYFNEYSFLNLIDLFLRHLKKARIFFLIMHKEIMAYLDLNYIIYYFTNFTAIFDLIKYIDS